MADSIAHRLRSKRESLFRRLSRPDCDPDSGPEVAEPADPAKSKQDSAGPRAPAGQDDQPTPPPPLSPFSTESTTTKKQQRPVSASSSLLSPTDTSACGKIRFESNDSGGALTPWRTTNHSSTIPNERRWRRLPLLRRGSGSGSSQADPVAAAPRESPLVCDSCGRNGVSVSAPSTRNPDSIEISHPAGAQPAEGGGQSGNNNRGEREKSQTEAQAEAEDEISEKPPQFRSPFGESSSRGAGLQTFARKQSLLAPSQQYLVERLLANKGGKEQQQQSGQEATASEPARMAPQRRVWVKRPGASATLITLPEDSIVDELRDHVLRKYANSLGKQFDAPDLMVRIIPREGSSRQVFPERMLNPEEALFALLDQYYPGGQTADDALVIEAPQRRTPLKPSPRQTFYYHAEPGEHGEYFPLMPVPALVGTPPAAGQPGSSSSGGASAQQQQQPHSISVLTTGKVPPLPSPGSRTARPSRRPPFSRHITNSPGQAKDANVVNPQPSAPHPQASLPTPPAPPAPPESPKPGARPASPRPGRRSKKMPSPGNTPFSGLIEETVPPINVLIVEDNVINQKLLEAFMKRLSVRWQCAPNGEVAVKKWRQGGFHLVLMDIQLPVMNGLEATKEIRRLERVNGIGVFPKKTSGKTTASQVLSGGPVEDSIPQEDILENRSLFKSPVIIVALTASSLQSDRHEALAAGCNDFLTKPVGFPWLEQKVTEWGCMQALIDFEGWRKWRGYADDGSLSWPQQQQEQQRQQRRQQPHQSHSRSSSRANAERRAASKGRNKVTEDS